MASSSFTMTGKHVLITGASSGLGAHFAKTLAGAGATVGLAARRRDRLVSLADAIGGNAHIIEMDVTDPSSIAAGIDAYAAAAGQLPDTLINNAGIADPKGFLDAERQDTKAVFETNQMAVFDTAQDLARRWVAQGMAGNIINIASIAGERVIGGAAAYAASKAAVAHLTKVQAMELARHNIRVNAIAPGYFATEINADFLQSDAAQKLIKRVPMRRIGAFQDLDGVLLLLASEMSSYMTGAVIPVDGGHLCASL